jgi:hypothetical protein
LLFASCPLGLSSSRSASYDAFPRIIGSGSGEGLVETRPRHRPVGYGMPGPVPRSFPVNGRSVLTFTA